MSDSIEEEEEKIEVVYDVQSVPSTPDPPLEEWSSFYIEPEEVNQKRLLYANNLYDPGSGEICTKYFAQSASSVFRHPYYKYPAIVDPGIKEAFLGLRPSVEYKTDGRDLYLAICKEMGQCPVRIFLGSLTTNAIDLSYYCVNPWGVRAMTKALELNPHVEIFNLTQNFLNDDACFHLGELLTKNTTLRELNLSGCRIGQSGLRRILAGLLDNYTLKTLNLNSNELDDVGGVVLAEAFQKGLRIKDLYLSYNNLSSATAEALTEGMEWNNKLSKLDLSWNILQSEVGTPRFLTFLQENPNLQWLNLSWNGIQGDKLSAALKKTLLAPKLDYLNLSNNKINDKFAIAIANSLIRAKKLTTLDLSTNPMTPVSATVLITKLRFRKLKIKNLIMDNIPVDEIFVSRLEQIKLLSYRSDLVVTTGPMIMSLSNVSGPDMRDVLLNRFHSLCSKRKKNKIDFAVFCLQLAKENEQFIPVKILEYNFKQAGADVDRDIIQYLAVVFPGPIVAKEKTVDLVKLVDYVKRKWPDARLPPTPPPEPAPPPPPPPPPKGKGKKGKK